MDNAHADSWNDLVVCDAHHHLWDRPNHRPHERFLIAEMRATIQAAGVPVRETIFVECGVGYRTTGPEHLRPVGETEYIANLDPQGLLAVILPRADLSSPAIDEVLGAHAEAADGRFRGVRHVVAWDADPGVPVSHTAPPPHLLGDSNFRAGARRLAHFGYTLDLWLFHTQLAEAAEFARSLPELTIVIDHLGGPLGVGSFAGRRAEVMKTWRDGIRELSHCPNVRLKIGGIGMPVFGMGWVGRQHEVGTEDIKAAWGRSIQWCIEEFTPQRCIFESNFPVDAVSFRYDVLWESYRDIASALTMEEQAWLFGDTARETYRIPTA